MNRRRNFRKNRNEFASIENDTTLTHPAATSSYLDKKQVYALKTILEHFTRNFT